MSESTIDSSSVSTGRATGAAARVPRLLFFVALLAIIGRGLLEITIGKTLAYAAQAGLFAALTLVIFIRFRRAKFPGIGWGIVLWWILWVSGLMSIFASAPAVGAQPAITYTAVMLFFGSTLLVYSSVKVAPRNAVAVRAALVIATLLSVIIAILQQFGGLTLLPGTDFGTLRTQARPSALTGSFLHYPILVALMSLALIGVYAARRRLIYLAVGVIGLGAVIVSFSRSGMVIVGVGLIFALLTAKSVRWFLRVVLIAPLLAAVAVLALPSQVYVNRFLSIFDSDGAGNAGRIGAWQEILDLWTLSPLLIGGHAGQYTNITSNLAPSGAVASPESGVLQVLISLGALGLIAYYGLMIRTIAVLPKNNPWFRAALVAGVVQSFFYQSIEVLPFMAIYSLMPLIAHSSTTRQRHSTAPSSARAALAGRLIQ